MILKSQYTLSTQQIEIIFLGGFNTFYLVNDGESGSISHFNADIYIYPSKVMHCLIIKRYLQRSIQIDLRSGEDIHIQFPGEPLPG